MAITFHYAHEGFRFRSTADLKKLIKVIFSEHGRQLKSLAIILCSDEYLLEINRQHLNHDYYTDIITFDLSQNEQTSGELYISIERVKDNAQQLQVKPLEEITRVIIHGALHLLGYGDKTTKEQTLMRSTENKYLYKYGKPFHVKPKGNG